MPLFMALVAAFHGACCRFCLAGKNSENLKKKQEQSPQHLLLHQKHNSWWRQ